MVGLNATGLPDPAFAADGAAGSLVVAGTPGELIFNVSVAMSIFQLHRHVHDFFIRFHDLVAHL